MFTHNSSYERRRIVLSSFQSLKQSGGEASKHLASYWAFEFYLFININIYIFSAKFKINFPYTFSSHCISLSAHIGAEITFLLVA